MDKEKLLEAYKKENLLNDERENYIKKDYFLYTTSFVSLAFIILYIVSKIYKINIESAYAMMYAAIVGGAFHNFRLRKEMQNKIERFGNILILISGSFLFIAKIIDMVIYAK